MPERLYASDDGEHWEPVQPGILNDAEWSRAAQRGIQPIPMSDAETLEYANGLRQWAEEVFRRAMADRRRNTPPAE